MLLPPQASALRASPPRRGGPLGLPQRTATPGRPLGAPAVKAGGGAVAAPAAAAVAAVEVAVEVAEGVLTPLLATDYPSGPGAPPHGGEPPSPPRGGGSGGAALSSSEERTATPRVGGRLALFPTAWRSITSDPLILRIIDGGLKIPFKVTPKLRTSPLWTPIPANLTKAGILRQEIASLVQKGACLLLSPEASLLPAVYSTFFLVPKRSGGWRPILNLKPTNKLIPHQTFKMDTIGTIKVALRPGLWATSIDLTDAYLHVPMAPQAQSFLRFAFEGRTYSWTSLPFGLSIAPRAFTLLVKEVASFLRREEGVELYQYLDDWLLVAPSREEALAHTATTLALLRRLGWLINLTKSRLTPSQGIDHLGCRLDLVGCRVYPSEERIRNLVRLASPWKDAAFISAGDLRRLLGHMASMVDVLPFCRFHMRPLNSLLLRSWDPLSQPVWIPIPLDREAHARIHWWLNRDNTLVGAPFPPEPYSHVIFTDACLTGWGGLLGDEHVSGVWSEDERSWHINMLELQAVILSLLQFERQLRGANLLVRTDNTTTVAYINREGGIRSQGLDSLARSLQSWTQERGIQIHAAHIKGVDNVCADALSRGMSQPTEWSLCPQVFNLLSALWGQPQMDLFASKENHLTGVYCSWKMDLHAFAMDAFSVSWGVSLNYAYPPFNLIQRVLARLEREGGEMILVAPLWPRQAWFSSLLRLLVEPPQTLPLREGLLRLAGLDLALSVPELSHLSLTAWRLSSSLSRRGAFLNRWRHSSQSPDDPPPERSTTADSITIFDGARNRISIPVRQLNIE